MYSTTPVQEREVVRDEREIVREDDRSWGKTAMVIGGSAAGGAGVGGIVGGKKGALIARRVGGGAASIYEQPSDASAEKTAQRRDVGHTHVPFSCTAGQSRTLLLRNGSQIASRARQNLCAVE